MAYMRQWAKLQGARRLGALPSHRRASKIICAGLFHTTVYGAWLLRKEEWKTVKEHAGERMDGLVVHDKSKEVYVSNLAQFARDVKAGRCLENWLAYCMLSCLRHTLPFRERSKVRRNALKFERRYRTGSEGSYFVGWHNGEFFMVLPE